MLTALVRIDDRLIHGQVVIGWIPYLQVDVVVVAADAAAADETQTALMQMAMPEGMELMVLSVAEASRRLRADADQRRALVLVPGPREALELLEQGVRFDSVNVGGLHFSAGRVQLGKAVYLSPEDKEALRAISKRGVTVEGRALPGDTASDILDMFEDEE